MADIVVFCVSQWTHDRNIEHLHGVLMLVGNFGHWKALEADDRSDLCCRLYTLSLMLVTQVICGVDSTGDLCCR